MSVSKICTRGGIAILLGLIVFGVNFSCKTASEKSNVKRYISATDDTRTGDAQSSLRFEDKSSASLHARKDAAQSETMRRQDSADEDVDEGVLASIVSTTKSAVCGIGDSLQSIDAVAIQGKVDPVQILAKGKSPVSVTAAYEGVLWDLADSDNFEFHNYLVTGTGVSHSIKDNSVVDGEAAVVFGCDGKPSNYTGWFVSACAYGICGNFGFDLRAFLERRYASRARTPSEVKADRHCSNVSGSDNVFGGECWESVTKDIEMIMGQLYNGFRGYRGTRNRKNYSRENPNGAYTFALKPIDPGERGRFQISMDEIMQEVRMDIDGWETNADALFKRAIQYINDRFQNSQQNEILAMLRKGASATRVSGETAASYRARLPGSLLDYEEVYEFFYPTTEGSLKEPKGVQQTLMSIAGHFPGDIHIHQEGRFFDIWVSSWPRYKGQNAQKFATAFNTEIKSTDGKGLRSVKAERHADIRRLMLGDGPHSCTRQRERYPDHRWFRVYTGSKKKTSYVFDCWGFCPRSKLQGSRVPDEAQDEDGKCADTDYKPGTSFRLYSEDDFNENIKPELTYLKEFFEKLNLLRRKTRYGAMLVHDSVWTQKDINSMVLGGSHVSGKSLTGCNSVSIGVKDLTPRSVTTGLSALLAFQGSFLSSSALGLRSAIALAKKKNPNVSASMTYYRDVANPFPEGLGLKSSVVKVPGGNIARAIRKLKSKKCD